MREDTDSQEYTMGYSAEFQQMITRRGARINTSHLLPHLKPGMQVLDFGCGPGTIFVGLARAVAPGMLHGIDMEASQIEMARDAARGARPVEEKSRCDSRPGMGGGYRAQALVKGRNRGWRAPIGYTCTF